MFLGPLDKTGKGEGCFKNTKKKHDGDKDFSEEEREQEDLA